MTIDELLESRPEYWNGNKWVESSHPILREMFPPEDVANYKVFLEPQTQELRDLIAGHLLVHGASITYVSEEEVMTFKGCVYRLETI